MSVKSKVKRCNEEIKRQEETILYLIDKNKKLNEIVQDYSEEHSKIKAYENILKYLIARQAGSVHCGMRIACLDTAMLNNLRITVDYDYPTDSYEIRVF